MAVWQCDRGHCIVLGDFFLFAMFFIFETDLLYTIPQFTRLFVVGDKLDDICACEAVARFYIF